MTKALAYWAAAPLLALVLYWPGLTGWFQKDDFAWLGLYNMVHGWRDLWVVMFHPFAQGTIRTLSERIFYTSFFGLFGMHPLPYRIWAFLTYLATVTLLNIVATRLTGSRAVGFWAAIMWTVNSGIAIAMSWTAIYYELLCSFSFLLGLWLLIRYVETGQRRFFIVQWIAFLAAFFILELNVVYPALAAAYALCCAPRILRKVLPMFVPSVVYTFIHMWASPLPSSGPYKSYWDGRVFSTLWTYWKWALGPSRLILFRIYPSPWRSALTALLALALIGFLISKLCRRQWLAAFFPAWFVIVLAPLLPLREHMMDYYLTIPLLGLAIWGAWAFVSSWHAGVGTRISGVALLALYVGVAIPLGRISTVSFYDRSQRIRTIVTNVVDLARANPSKTILLSGVDSDMFWSAIFHRPFRLYGISDVYLVPENQAAIEGDIQSEDAGSFFIDPVEERKLIDEHRAVFYDVSSLR